MYIREHRLLHTMRRHINDTIAMVLTILWQYTSDTYILGHTPEIIC